MNIVTYILLPSYFLYNAQDEIINHSLLLYCCHLVDSNVQLLSTVRFWNFINWLHLYCCICNVSYFDVNKCMPNIRQCVSLLNVLNHAWLSGFSCYKKNITKWSKTFLLQFISIYSKSWRAWQILSTVSC